MQVPPLLAINIWRWHTLKVGRAGRTSCTGIMFESEGKGDAVEGQEATQSLLSLIQCTFLC